MRHRPFVAGENASLPALEVAPPAFAAAWLLCFSIPWDDMILLPGQIQLARVVSLAVALIWVCSVLRGGSVRRPDIAHGWMAAFVLWAAVSVFWSDDPEHTVRRALSYLQLFAIAWVFYQFSANRACHLRLLQAFVVGEYVLLAFVLTAYFTGEVWGEGRYTAPGVNPNDLASTLALGVPIACYLLAIRSRWSFWFNALYVPAAVMCILLNASRGGVLTLAAAAIFPLLLLPRLRWRARIAISAVLALSVLAALNLTETYPWRRVSTIAEQFAARDLNGRFDVWNTAIDLFESHPVVGIGAGTFVRTTGSRQTRSIAGHNSFLEVLVENGAIGLVLLLAIIASVVRNRYRATRIETLLWRIVLAAWAVTNLTCSWENKDVTWLLWGLALGHPAPQRSPAAFAFQQGVPMGFARLEPASAGKGR